MLKIHPKSLVIKLLKSVLSNVSLMSFDFFSWNLWALFLVPEVEVALRSLPILAPVKLPTGVKNRPTVVEAMNKCRENFIVDITVIFFLFVNSVFFFFETIINLGCHQCWDWGKKTWSGINFEVIGSGYFVLFVFQRFEIRFSIVFFLTVLCCLSNRGYWGQRLAASSWHWNPCFLCPEQEVYRVYIRCLVFFADPCLQTTLQQNTLPSGLAGPKYSQCRWGGKPINSKLLRLPKICSCSEL